MLPSSNPIGTSNSQYSTMFSRPVRTREGASYRSTAGRASGAVLDRLQAYRDAGIPVLHWFSGPRRDLECAIELGCWFSVGPAMLRSRTGRALAALMPRDRVLTESDGPFAQEGRDAPDAVAGRPGGSNPR